MMVAMRLWSLLGIVLLFACNGGGDPVETSTDGTLDAGTDSRWAETGAGEVPDVAEGPDIPTPDLGDPDVPLDSSGCAPGEGCFLDPCLENSDCLSGWCVDHMGGSVCTTPCEEDCPEGWSCMQLGTAGRDVFFVCVSEVPTLCRPCGYHADCKAPSGLEVACVDYGPGAGSFCGAACDDGACPEGYVCQEMPTVDGLLQLQCVPASGDCGCTPKSIAASLGTPCEVVNEHGTCGGFRVCAAEGLTACDAAAAVPESCDGVDDDCDGETDEGTCDDGNPCTDDSCAGAAGCDHVALDQGECMDGNPCTVADHCAQGVCEGTWVDCDDGNPCTEDGCTPEGGCTFTPVAAACTDGDPCTLGDHCQDGACVGEPVACECTSDADCAALEDGDLCNGTLVCDTGAMPYLCVVAPDSPIDCPPPPGGADALCLEPACAPASGACSLVPDHQGMPCDDGDPCSVGDACLDGACVPGTATNCNDGDPCTDDTCDPTVGCVHALNTGPCDDGDPCTFGDLCQGGACLPGTGIDCGDGNPCTDDSCTPGEGCVHVANAAPCDDDNPCTLGDHCEGGVCLFTGGQDCDDDNPCTDDHCSPLSGCVHVLNQSPCDDGDLCTTGDHCHLGACISGGALTCSDGNPCTDDTCAPETGCVFAANAAPCNDGNPCTEGDHCAGGACVIVGTLPCDDGNPCTDDSCDPLSGCLHVPNAATCSDGDPCTTGDACVGGACVAAGPATCDDDNPCTDDWCLAGQGCHHAYNTIPCEDGDLCTSGDLCTDGSCIGGAPAACDDSNPCTDDQCLPALGCVFTPNQAPCDDGDACTPVSVCQAGACVGEGGVFCDVDAWCAQNGGVAACFTGSCDPDQGCVFAAIPGCCGNLQTEAPEQCDDGNLVDGDGCSVTCQNESPCPPDTAYINGYCWVRAIAWQEAHGTACSRVGKTATAKLVPMTWNDALLTQIAATWGFTSIGDYDNAAKAMWCNAGTNQCGTHNWGTEFDNYGPYSSGPNWWPVYTCNP